MEDKIPFSVVRGLENKIELFEYQDGRVYFATDTKKIYLDAAGKRTPMGGNTGIFYANSQQPDLAEEFFFLPSEIEDNLIPNVKDLIINTDGCFYRVEGFYGEKIKASRITIAGGGPNGSYEEKGTMNLEILNISGHKTILAGKAFTLEFNYSAVDKDGASTGDGRYEIYINDICRERGKAIQGKVNSITLTKYFTEPNTYNLRVVCYGYLGTATEYSLSKYMTITASRFELEWKYEDTTIYKTSQDFDINWNIDITEEEKVSTSILINDIYKIETESFNLHLTPQELKDLKLGHGAHKFELQGFTTIDNEIISTDKVIKNIMFWDDEVEEDPGYIINCKYFNKSITQYDTIQIPVMIYHETDNVNGTASIDFKVDGKLKPRKTNCENLKYYTFSYTPDKSGIVSLQFLCGSNQVTFNLEVYPLDLDIEEIKDYAFKFKASDFATDEEVQAWSFKDENNIERNIIFSNNFDWINGGLQSGEDDVGPYFKIQAGSYLTIPYKIFHKDIKGDGACFKIIFKAHNCRDYDASVIECLTTRTYKKPIKDEKGEETGEYETVESNIGLSINAQNSYIGSLNNELICQYCEDTYLEYEFDVCKYDIMPEAQYLTVWMDGIPAGVVNFSSGDSFSQLSSAKDLRIGSEDCDVYIYLIKYYTKHLTSEEHLTNFIMDAPNPTEMVQRFKRNDILTKDNKGNTYISPYLLAEKNPECNVYIYELPSIPTKKLDEKKNQYVTGNFTQLKGSRSALRYYDNVKVGAQGTSSMTYGLSAFNLDTKFPEAWSMDEEAIPVNYYNTKVNVASCEGANNALNQEWYNRNQPYKTQKRLQQREDGKKARDTMQFQNGVVFVKDLNKNTNASDKTANNVFKEINGYINNPYPRMYSIGNMGNSKKNTDVFHGAGNAYECCVENADNNTSAQRMLIVPGCYFETEIDGIQIKEHEVALDLPEELFDENGFVVSGIDWGETLDPELENAGLPKEQCWVDNKTMWKNSLINEGFFEFRYSADEDEYDKSLFNSYDNYLEELSNRFLRLVRWFALNNPSAATNEELETPVVFEDYKVKGINATAYSNYNTEDEVLKGKIVPGGKYTHDTAEYRVAKMLRESENYLILDSIIYHYIFIERHTMVDNVAKNTFWNTENGIHWELTKNYDNDTADGVNNSGYLVYNYGIEVMDNDKNNNSIFNARPSSWLHFAHGLKTLREEMYLHLHNNPNWNYQSYLDLFNNWQNVIPEICWIEDFNRKYFRPNNIYGDSSYLERLANGKKTHQRQQYETYQQQYISSEYKTSTLDTTPIQWRSRQPKDALNSDGEYEIKGRVKMYADGYFLCAFASGSGHPSTINIHLRGKKGEYIEFSKKQKSSFDDATCYVYSPLLYQEFINLETMYPEYFTAVSADKLRKISLIAQEEYQENALKDSLSFSNNIEELEFEKCKSTTAMEMNLPSLTRLKKLNTKDSAFTGYVIADGAPISIFTINEPESLELSNLFYLTKENQNFNIQSYSKLRKIDIKNIDYNDVNSKELIDNMIKAAESADNKDFEYNLENVKWTFSKEDNITDSDIPLLDYILTYGTTLDNKLPRLALTGVADIPDSAYNGNNALQLYEKYCLKKIDNKDFANLILNFINSNGTKKLCSITIKNGNGENKWYRQFNSFDNINNDYLSQSSFGAFDVKGTVTKRNENEIIYTFDNRWKCTAGNKQFEIKGTDVNTQYLDLSLIKDALIKYEIGDNIKDIIIEPIFSEDTRYYSVIFKDSVSGDIIHSVDNAIYGSTFDMIKPKTLPYKSDVDLPLEETFYLKGYTTTIATENESPMLTEENTWKLTDNTIFYPVFERRNVYTIDYSDYLWINNDILTGLKTIGDKNMYQGTKIVIPKNVKEIEAKAFGYDKISNIRYIFVEPESNLEIIGESAFGGNDYNANRYPIAYFDFNNCSKLKTIMPYAFRSAKFDTTYYGNSPEIRLPLGLETIGQGSFNGSIDNQSKPPVTLYIPYTVKTIQPYGIAHWTANGPSEVIIGDPDHFSNLDITNQSNGNIISSNSSSKDIAKVTIYTTKYSEVELDSYISDNIEINIVNQ